MKTLSQWASRHSHIAILLIILGELVNGFNGVLLGANLFGELPPVYLYISMLALIGLTSFVLLYVKRANLTGIYWVGRRWLFAAFLSNFLLFILLGGLWNQGVQTTHPSISVLGSRRSEVVRDTLAPANSERSVNQLTVQASDPTDQPKAQWGTYILLGILGILVTGFITGLACNIACAGYGFLALLTFFVGLGGYAGAVYFFSRAAQKSPKRRRDMTPDERKRDTRRFWLTWLLTIGVVTVLALLVAIL